MICTLLSRLALFAGLLALPFLAGTGLQAVEDSYPDGSNFFELDDEPINVTDDRAPMLGVQMSPPSRRVLERNNLDADTGIYVHRVYDDTAAQQLGIERGDVITAINGRPISSMTDLREIVLHSEVGDGVEVSVRRDGEDLNLSGGAYQPWPDSIPYRELDPAAEQRYRDLQRRRLGQNLNQMDDLVAQNEQLQEDLQNARDLSPLASSLGLPENLLTPREELPRLADGSEPTLLPPELLALPGWSFDYAFAANDSKKLQTSLKKSDFTGLPVSQPQLGLTYQFDVSSEYY